VVFRSLSNWILVFSLAVAAVIVWYVMLRVDVGTERVRVGYQDSAAPLELPSDGRGIDHRFDLLLAWERARVPKAEHFDWPMGGESGAWVYNAQAFWEMNALRGGRHLGDDLNGIGGMNTDMGDNVYAIADGLVLFAGEAGTGWGKVVVVGHEVPGKGMIHSMYAHLDQMHASSGMIVPRGRVLGTVGTVGGMYPAHLHLELRATDHIDIGAGYGLKDLNRLDPSLMIGEMRKISADDLRTSFLGVWLSGDKETDLTIEMPPIDK
jgi:murein DD-endopeptidase MepM/ murein hydrolase activator NlpD